MKKELKRVYITQDYLGNIYIIPYCDTDLFYQLNEEIKIEIDEGTSEEYFNGLLDSITSFNINFNKYATGADINLIELYARI